MSTRPVSKPGVYGLIEWDGWQLHPTLIVGCCFDAVARTAVRILAHTHAAGGAVAADDPQFLTHHPIPDPADPGADIGGWLDALREATTQPWFTLLERDEMVHTSDETIQVHPTSALPCTCRPDGHHTASDASAQPGPLPAIPIQVNGYPVVAVAAQSGHGDSWIVICRTENAPYLGGQCWYVTWRVWFADGAYHAENGDYGPHHGLTWTQAQHSMLRRLGYRHTLRDHHPVSADTATVARLHIDGEHIDVSAQRLRPDLVRVALRDSHGFGCGQAQLCAGTLSIDLPEQWSPSGRAEAACLIAHICYTALETR